MSESISNEAAKTESTTPTPNETATTGEKPKNDPATLVDALFDIGLSWAAHGLQIAKGALEVSGKTLDTTAKTLERLAEELKKKDTHEKQDKTAA